MPRLPFRFARDLGRSTLSKRRGRSAAFAALFVVGILAACGDETRIDPVSVAPTLTPISIIGGDPPRIDAATGSPGASPLPGEMADVGALVSRVNAAWAGVTSYRAVEVSALGAPDPTGASPVASPVGLPGSSVVVDEVIFPDQRHQMISEGGQTSEVIATGGLLYVRGSLATTFVDARAGGATWLVVDPARVPAGSPLGVFVSRFIGAEATVFTAPFGVPSEETRRLPIRPLGPVTVEGRACEAYDVVQTTLTGERVEITLAIDALGLPCYQETRAGTSVNRLTFVVFDVPIDISVPADAVPSASFGPVGLPASPDASPVASPVASPTS